MKHIKDFKLNEDSIGDKNPDPKTSRGKLFYQVRDYIIGSIIEEHEFTDAFLEKPDVKHILGVNIDILTDEVEKILKKGADGLGKTLLSVLPKQEKKLPRYDKNYNPSYGSKGYPR